MALPGQKNLSAFIDQQLSEEFNSHCEAKGIVKRRAIESAVRLWLSVQANSDDDKMPPKEFRDQIEAVLREFGLIAKRKKPRTQLARPRKSGR